MLHTLKELWRIFFAYLFRIDCCLIGLVRLRLNHNKNVLFTCISLFYFSVMLREVYQYFIYIQSYI